jgi:hypothetical protein
MHTPGATALALLVFANPAKAMTDTFSFTGAAQSWTAPAGVHSAMSVLDGAAGGAGDGTPRGAGLISSLVPSAPSGRRRSE